MRLFFGCLVAAGILGGLASDSKAQVTFSLGNPYTSPGVAIGQPYYGGYTTNMWGQPAYSTTTFAQPGYVQSYSYSAPATSYYSSAYRGFAPASTYYAPGYTSYYGTTTYSTPWYGTSYYSSPYTYSAMPRRIWNRGIRRGWW